MSVEAMNWAYRQTVGKPVPKAILVALANQADQDGKCWPSVEYISKRVEVTPRRVMSNIDYLVEAGFLTRERRGGDGSGRKTNVYHLNLDTSNVTQRHEGQRDAKEGQRDAASPKQSINNQHIPQCAWFEKARNLKPRHPNDHSTYARQKWDATIKKGATPEALYNAWAAYVEWCKSGGASGPRFMMHMRTFFGPAEHWKREWEPLGEVPEDRRSILKLAAENNIQFNDNTTLAQLRREIANQTGMRI